MAKSEQGINSAYQGIVFNLSGIFRPIQGNHFSGREPPSPVSVGLNSSVARFATGHFRA